VEPLNRTGSPSGESEARLIDLLSAAVPTALPESQKRASLATILSPEQPQSRGGLRLGGLALVFGILFVLAGASTAATLGARWIAERHPAAAPPAVGRPAAQPSTTVRSRPTATSRAPMVEPSAEEMPVIPITVPSRNTFAASPRPRQSHGENPSAVMDAVKALRQDHDPTEARRLLREYLRLYPRGSLAEEARALSFEAARAARSPDAVALANDYLTLYPHGRFQKAAEQAARSSRP
jgi:hypothetical protein